MQFKCQNIRDIVAIIKPDLRVATAETGPEMYEELDRNFDQFKGHSLISAYEFSNDWPGWERHPAGDEVVMLLSGHATIVLRKESGDEKVTLKKEGDYIIIPRGLWHTAKCSTPTRMLFITPGENTEHSENPDT